LKLLQEVQLNAIEQENTVENPTRNRTKNTTENRTKDIAAKIRVTVTTPKKEATNANAAPATAALAIKQ
tara:strand:+ start:16 stop:222 length:207 start_codon:yes stop_codon:yes gene_type:complete